MKYQNITEEKWDYLIVLDACRFDFFKDLQDEFLSGNLEKRKSKGSSTLDWLVNSFPNEYEITYFSANPYINSKGVPLNRSKWGASCGYSWNPAEHFSEIVDVWEFGWKEELGTVHPSTLNEAFHERENGKRTILHYMQPHAPYLSNGNGRKLKRIKKGLQEVDNNGHNENMAELKRWIRSKLENYMGKNRIITKIGMLLDLRTDTLFSEVRENGVENTLKKYYKDNLKIALKHVSKLIDDLDGKIIVTSDHGEAFGESGVWEHHIQTPIPPLIEVPWLEVEEN